MSFLVTRLKILIKRILKYIKKINIQQKKNHIYIIKRKKHMMKELRNLKNI